MFLDEFGEMELLLQVKLLRAIETRRFSAVGDTALREFRGKLIAATNRDLPERDPQPTGSARISIIGCARI